MPRSRWRTTPSLPATSAARCSPAARWSSRSCSRRLVKRRGHGKALVAVARSMLVVVWHLLSDADARFRDLGADYHLRVCVTCKRG